MNKKQRQLGKTRENAAGEASPPVIQGFKYVRWVGHLLPRLHGATTERDRAGNRQLFDDHYATLVLLYFFTPTVTSLRGLQQLTPLAYVQRRWGVQRTALGSLSEAATVFEAALLQDVISELALRAWTRAPKGTPALLKGDMALVRDLVAIDGSLLPALPRMVWAVWQDEQHRAAKMHVAFAALRQVPVGVTVTAGTGAERTQARQLVQPGGFYVFDRGDVDDELVADLHALPCSFIVRIQAGAAYEVAQERPLAAAARTAGVTCDSCCGAWGPRILAPARRSLCGWCAGPRTKSIPPVRRSSWCWSPIAWTWRPTSLPWPIAIAGPWNSSSAGSNVSWAVAICSVRVSMACKCKSTWRCLPACS